MPHGPLDPRMGTCDPAVMCATCKSNTCLHGHYGHLELALPIYNSHFKDTTVKNTLQSVCYFCAKLLSGKKCGCCKRPQPTYKPSATGIHAEWRPKDIEALDPEATAVANTPFSVYTALQILRSISDNDAALLGFDLTRPESCITCVVVVPPIWMRPTKTVENGNTKAQDGLSVFISRLAGIQAKMRAWMESNNITADNEFNPFENNIIPQPLLAMHNETFFTIAMYSGKMSSKSAALQKETAKADKGYRMRTRAIGKTTQMALSGKKGLFRQNAMGKRVDHCARAVIVPDCTLDADEVGVPEKIYMTLTYPAKVTDFNMPEMQLRILRGPYDRDGARFVISPTGQKYNLDTFFTRRSELASTISPGWIVERLLIDGDYVIMNRQPTLHKLSMLAFKVRRLPPGDDTFHLHHTSTTPFNADFDGDEMNMHVVQTEEARAEVQELISIEHNIINSHTGPSNIGFIQDTILALHTLSLPETRITKAEMYKYCMYLKDIDYSHIPPPITRVPVDQWSGKQLLAMFVPTEILHNPPAQIRAGLFFDGIFSKRELGCSADSLIAIIAAKCGGKAAIEFISTTQRMAESFWFDRGFSVGLDDIRISPETRTEINDLVAKAQAFDSQDEHAIIGTYQTLLNDVGNAIETEMKTRNNSIYTMAVKAGTKGTISNMAQMIGLVGQQLVAGKRINPRHKLYTTPTHRGMIFNGFAKGLTPQEFFCHAASSREGLTDTACKTGITGYMARRLMKALESVQLCQDNTIRNGNSRILCFEWTGGGNVGDGIGATAAQNIIAPVTQMTLSAFHYIGHGDVQCSVDAVEKILSVSNTDLKTVYSTYGIEALREAIGQKLQELLEAGGAEVDPRYIDLLADYMTAEGVPSSIKWNGMKKQTNLGPLDLATFEQPIRTITENAAIGVSTKNTGVSASILLGKRVELGTGQVTMYNVQ